MLPYSLSSRYWFKELPQSRWFHPLLLLLWLVVGTVLRFARLDALPPWTDEFATMVFSMGHSFTPVPLDQMVSSEVLLQPVQPTADAGIGAVVERLLQESTHPPVYFVLVHLWLKLFPAEGGLVPIWGVRSLSALLGIASIPATFGLGYLAFRSRLVGQIAAAMMAISPFGVFLARDARHYTLAILLVIASLCCLVVAVRGIHRREPLPMGMGLVWVGVNSLGMATHYFFTLTLCAEGIVVLAQAWQDRGSLMRSHWRRIYAVAAGTLIGCLVWLPALQAINGSEPTNWIYDGNPTVEWFAPIGRFLLWALSMVVLLPSAVTVLPIWIVVISGLLTLLLLVGIMPSLQQGFKIQQQYPDTRLGLQVLGGYVVGAIALVFGFTYGLGMDITLGARFQFVYFPAVIVLFGGMLAGVWQKGNLDERDKEVNSKGVSQFCSPAPPLPRSPAFLLQNGKVVVAIAWLMGLVGGLTVIWNLGYLQNHRPDLLVPIIREASHAPVLIATTHKHHGQTGRMMGLAWEFKRLSAGNSSGDDPTASAQFFLADRDSETRSYDDAVEVFQETLAELPRPLDLWLVDFRAEVDLESQDCVRDKQYGSWAGEYKYKLYRCLAKG